MCRLRFYFTVALERDSIDAKRAQLAALKAQVGAIKSLMNDVTSNGTGSTDVSRANLVYWPFVPCCFHILIQLPSPPHVAIHCDYFCIVSPTHVR